MRYFVDNAGNYIGAYDEKCDINDSWVEVNHAPNHAGQKWDGNKFLTYVDYYEQMANLEATRTHRREREARMGIAGAQQWLDDLDSEIEALRPEL